MLLPSSYATFQNFAMMIEVLNTDLTFIAVIHSIGLVLLAVDAELPPILIILFLSNSGEISNARIEFDRQYIK
jgi:hypothetical protein